MFKSVITSKITSTIVAEDSNTTNFHDQCLSVGQQASQVPWDQGRFPPNSPWLMGHLAPERAKGWLYLPAASHPEMEACVFPLHCFKNTLSLCVGGHAEADIIKRYLELWRAAAAAKVWALAARSSPTDLAGPDRDTEDLLLSQTRRNPEGFLLLKARIVRCSPER